MPRAQGVEVLAVLADIADATDVERFAATALERFGGVDVLVNNAAELGPLPLPQLTDAPSSALEHVLQANVLGPLRLTQAVIGGMLLRNHGLVVNISTDAALIGFEGLGLYSASKAALDALTRSWSAELQRTAGAGDQCRPRRHAYGDAHGRRPGGQPGGPAPS